MRRTKYELDIEDITHRVCKIYDIKRIIQNQNKIIIKNRRIISMIFYNNKLLNTTTNYR